MARSFLIVICWLALAAGSRAESLTADALRYYYPVPRSNPPQTITTDVCVYGATPAGITAAIETARMGRSAVLVEFGRHVGGMTASGLSATDGGSTAGGIAAEFYGVLGKRGFAPSAAEAQFKAMLEAAGVRVFYEQRLAAVQKDGPAIAQIAMENGNGFKAKMFIDATYEGDLLAMAGVSFAVGREANAQYHETLNGVHLPPSGHYFRHKIDPYVVPGDPASCVLPGITNTAPDAPGPNGAGDRRVQAYNFRMYLAPMPHALPFPKPAGYDPQRYALLLRYLHAGAGSKDMQDFAQLHAGDSNNSGAISTDDIGMNYDWPTAAYAQREKIFQEHVTYQQGLMYFLVHDPGVPERIRKAVEAYGLAEGNFPETGGWPHQLYVREGRRMVGAYVMTEHNCRSEVSAEDSIGLAEYNMDSHNVQRFIMQKGGETYVQNEGDVQVHVPHPYPIAYRAIVPRGSDCTNLLVPVCLSCTHIAYGSIRMEPVFMVLGQSAGEAAVLAIEQGVAVQDVDYAKLRQRLLTDRQNLEWHPKPK